MLTSETSFSSCWLETLRIGPDMRNGLLMVYVNKANPKLVDRNNLELVLYFTERTFFAHTSKHSFIVVDTPTPNLAQPVNQTESITRCTLKKEISPKTGHKIIIFCCLSFFQVPANAARIASGSQRGTLLTSEFRLAPQLQMA